MTCSWRKLERIGSQSFSFNRRQNTNYDFDVIHPLYLTMEDVSNNILLSEHVSTNTFLSLNFNFEVRKVYSFHECITVNLVFVKTCTNVVIGKVCLEVLLKELEEMFWNLHTAVYLYVFSIKDVSK